MEVMQRHYPKAKNLKHLYAKHREVLRLHLLGHTGQEISALLGMSPGAVSRVLCCPLGRERLEIMQAEMDREAMDVASRLQESAGPAVDFLDAIVTGEVETTTQLRAKTCMDVLSRAGYSPVTRNVNLDMHGSLTEDDIKAIKQAAFQRDDVVEVEVSEEEGDNGRRREAV